MKVEDFNKLVNRRLKMIWDTLIAKAKEYSTDVDRLENFKTGAMLQGLSMAECLRGYMTKHVTSVMYTMLKDPTAFTKVQWDEKLGDWMVYLILLEAVIDEESNAKAGSDNSVR